MKAAWQVSFIFGMVLVPAAVLAGMPVTDPMSYTYYVQQLKTMGEQVNKAADQVNKLGEINKQVQSMEGQLKGHYNRAVGVLDDLKKAKQTVENVPGTVAGAGQEFAQSAEELTKGKKDGYTDARKALDALFKDPRKGGNGHQPDKTDGDRQYQAREAALRDAIVTADGLLQQMPDAFGTIKRLAQAIDATQNVKDATDLTNRILVEILKTVTQLLVVEARLTQASGMVHYNGVTDEVTRERLASLSEAANGKNGVLTTFKQKLSTIGIDTSNITDASFQRAALSFK